MQLSFRYDINGLRAIAVTTVLFYHFRVPGFSAGFIGVDIFFVISGFLMTAILKRSLEEKHQRPFYDILWSFYVGRFRRIFPALMALVTILLFIGWWTLGPEDYKRLAEHAQSTLLFKSNYNFYNEAGYFDLQSQEKWLLHTWSLSVEWQFYLILPLVLIAIWKSNQNQYLTMIIVGVIISISFFYNIQSIETDPAATFYLLPSRSWELLLGSLTYLLYYNFKSSWLYINSKFQTFLHRFGLILICIALFVIKPSTPWPNYLTLLPIIGTCLVLFASKNNSQWSELRIVKWVGTSSYSIYLWHWPIFVGLTFMDLQTKPLAIIVSILFAMILARLSFDWIEQPSRHIFISKRSKLAKLPFIIAAVIIIFASSIIINFNGMAFRMPVQFNNIMAETKNINPHLKDCHGGPKKKSFPWCIIGGDNIKAVIVGDSHASNIVNAVLRVVKTNAFDSVVMSTYTSCQPLLGIKKTDTKLKCNEFYDFVNLKLKSIPNDVPLIIAARMSMAIFGSHLSHDDNFGVPSIYFGENPSRKVTDEYLLSIRSNIIRSACYWSKERPVYWLLPFPEFPKNVPRWLARKYLFKGYDSEITIQRNEYNKRNHYVNSVLTEATTQCKNFYIIDVSKVLCDEEKCYGSLNGMPIYYDMHHLSERGIKYLEPLLKDMLIMKKIGKIQK